ncbi:MAG: hypothetical protein SFV53_05735 [Rickettsiales bacterium]|nr:hypothetical protein [Rickettsiales bacterium]
MFNEKFWLAIAFLAFIAALFKFAKSSIIKSIDDKSKKIAEEILQAHDLKEKAEKLLQTAEKYAAESAVYSKKLMQDAEIEAQRFLDEAKKTANEEINKKTNAAFERIKQEQLQTIRNIKSEILTSALNEIENGVLKNLDQKQNEIVLSQATSVLSKNI